jgi:YD repeat-containing protein
MMAGRSPLPPVLGLCLALAPGLTAGPGLAESIAIKATPVPLNVADPSATTVGRLRYRGGLQLDAESPRFGGFSALGVSADGARIVAISDRAQNLTARLTYDAAGNLAGITDADLGSLADLHGFPITDPADADAEAMSPGVEGEIIVAFENRHRLWRYLPGRTVPVPMPPPDEILQMPANSGIKGLALLSDGRLLALTPGVRGRTGAVGWVSDPNGWSVLTYDATDNFQVSGATTLPDGDVLVLERLYVLRGGNAARLKRVDDSAIRAGAVLTGDTVAELRPPLTVDNFEGVEARRGAKGETLFYLISDDNFNAEQRTLLMMFELIK